ncbi:hypothetical protein JHK86_056787 [Glycine max]|nr:hypothetical protein JHK86_056787 [Glycine max]
MAASRRLCLRVRFSLHEERKALCLLEMSPPGKPNLAVRVLNMKEQLNLMSLDKGPVTPSGPSTCTYIPGTGGKNCPPLEEMNVAGNYVQHHSDETYPRLVVPFGVATNQH